MPYIPTISFQRLITPSNFIGPSQPPTDTILSLLGPHTDTTGIMTLSLPNSSASNAQQQRLLLPPPSVTLPIQHLLEPFTTPPSTPMPSETSSDEASKRPIRNKSFGSRSSLSLSPDDVDLKKNSTFRCQKPLVRLIEESTPVDSEADQGQRSFK